MLLKTWIPQRADSLGLVRLNFCGDSRTELRFLYFISKNINIHLISSFHTLNSLSSNKKAHLLQTNFTLIFKGDKKNDKIFNNL